MHRNPLLQLSCTVSLEGGRPGRRPERCSSAAARWSARSVSPEICSRLYRSCGSRSIFSPWRVYDVAYFGEAILLEAVYESAPTLERDERSFTSKERIHCSR